MGVMAASTAWGVLLCALLLTPSCVFVKAPKPDHLVRACHTCKSSLVATSYGYINRTIVRIHLNTFLFCRSDNKIKRSPRGMRNRASFAYRIACMCETGGDFKRFIPKSILTAASCEFGWDFFFKPCGMRDLEMYTLTCTVAMLRSSPTYCESGREDKSARETGFLRVNISRYRDHVVARGLPRRDEPDCVQATEPYSKVRMDAGMSVPVSQGSGNVHDAGVAWHGAGEDISGMKTWVAAGGGVAASAIPSSGGQVIGGEGYARPASASSSSEAAGAGTGTETDNKGPFSSSTKKTPKGASSKGGRKKAPSNANTSEPPSPAPSVNHNQLQVRRHALSQRVGINYVASPRQTSFFVICASRVFAYLLFSIRNSIGRVLTREDVLTPTRRARSHLRQLLPYP
jgi:hypothetical protein